MALRNMLNIYRIFNYNMNRTLKKTVEVTIMTRSRESGVRGGEGGLRGYNNDVKVGGWVDSGW